MMLGLIGGASRLLSSLKGLVGCALAAGVFAAGGASAHPIGAPHVHLPAGVGAVKFVRIGSKVVADGLDRDEIRLPGRERVFQVKLCVRERAVEFFDFDVRFANGGNQDVRIRRVIRPGQCTRNIDLRGAPRNVRKVVMKYSSLRKRGRQPIVDVYARVALGSIGRPSPRRNFVLVGRKIVADRLDRDEIRLPGAERVFQVKLCVRGRAVEFLDLDVRFANGRNQDIPIRRVIRAGQCTRNIDLRGAPRNLSKIVMKYTSLRKRGPQPVVEVLVR